MNLFRDCGRAFDLKYNQKIVSVKKGSALYFGTSIDESLNVALLSKSKKEPSKKDATDVFLEHWTNQKNNQNEVVSLQNNPDISFFKGDFDSKLIDPEDAKNLGIILDEAQELFEDLYPKKDSLSIEDSIKLNNLFWASLKTKGLLLVAEYKKTMLPLVEETLEVQKFLSLKNKEGDLFRGVVDGIVRLEDGSVVCLDNKTSSVKYGEDSVKKSEQLALYQLILQNQGYHIDKCAYFVLHKKLLSKNKVKTEIIIDKVPATMLVSVLNELSKVNFEIKAGMFSPNFNSCKKPWGMCEYFNLCHNNSMDGLLKLEDKK